MKKHLLALTTVMILAVPFLVIFGYCEPNIFGFVVVNVLYIGVLLGVYSILKSRKISKSERQVQLLIMLIFPPYILYVIYK